MLKRPVKQIIKNTVIDLETGCWNWIGTVTEYGYGRVRSRDSKTRAIQVFRAHRVSYELFVGPIPNGLVLDHLCLNKRCVNPAHLEPVTSAENTRRSWLRGDHATPASQAA